MFTKCIFKPYRERRKLNFQVLRCFGVRVSPTITAKVTLQIKFYQRVILNFQPDWPDLFKDFNRIAGIEINIKSRKLNSSYQIEVNLEFQRFSLRLSLSYTGFDCARIQKIQIYV